MGEEKKTHAALSNYVDSTSLENGETILVASRRCDSCSGDAEDDAEGGGELHGSERVFNIQ